MIIPYLPPDLYPIRLQGPWDFHPGATTVPTNISATTLVRVKLPATWETLGLPLDGQVLLSRRFQRPTRMESIDQFLIMVPDGGEVKEAKLNGCTIELSRLLQVPATNSNGDHAIIYRVANVTPHLAATNRLEITFIVSPPLHATGIPVERSPDDSTDMDVSREDRMNADTVRVDTSESRTFSLPQLQHAVIVGIMPDADGSWWSSLPTESDLAY
ncbi:MAG: hypothetical protein R3C01_03135 [Planctomycetaceae bacterium]